MVIQTKGIYQDGVLKPEKKLALPENTPVDIQVVTTTSTARPEVTGSLFGAFPELATLNGDDFAWAKRLWDHGIEKQSRIVDDLSSG